MKTAAILLLAALAAITGAMVYSAAVVLTEISHG